MPGGPKGIPLPGSAPDLALSLVPTDVLRYGNILTSLMHHWAKKVLPLKTSALARILVLRFTRVVGLNLYTPTTSIAAEPWRHSKGGEMTRVTRMGLLVAAVLFAMTLVPAKASTPVLATAAPETVTAAWTPPPTCRGRGSSLNGQGSGGGGSLNCGGAPAGCASY